MPSKARIPIRPDVRGANESHAETIFPTLIERTERQVDMLLSIVDCLENHCFKAPENPTRESNWQECSPELAKKAEATAIAALGQLDNIIDDMSRWDAAGGALEQTYTRYLENAARLSEASALNAQQSTLPHARYGCSLIRVDLNDWVAVLGSGTKEQVMGRGPTAYDALKDFDRKFLQGFDPASKIVTLEYPTKAKTIKKPRKTKP